MADHRVDDLLVHIQLMEHLLGLDAVLLRVQLKIDIVQHPHGTPEVHVLRVKLPGQLSHHLRDSLRVLDMKGFLIITHHKLFGLFRAGDITHVFSLLCNC